MKKITQEEKDALGLQEGSNIDTLDNFNEGQSTVDNVIPKEENNINLPGELIVDDTIAPDTFQEELEGEQLGFFDTSKSALISNLPGMYDNDNSRGFDKDWSLEDRTSYFDEVKESYGETFYNDLLHNDTFNTNQAYIEQKKKNMLEDIQHQENIYEYGDFSGALLFNMGAQLLNPAEWALAFGTLGASKYIRIGQQIDAAYKLGKMGPKTYKSLKTGLGAAEGAIVGYGGEKIRQESSDIYNSDDLTMAASFGGLLGGAARGISTKMSSTDIKLSDNFRQTLSVEDQKKLIEIEEAEITKNQEIFDETNVKEGIREENLSTRENIANSNSKKLNDDEIGYFSNVTKYFTIPSPVKDVYNNANSTYQSVIRDLVSPFALMKNKNGDIITFNNTNANDLKERYVAEIDVSMRKQGIAWKSFNDELRSNNQQPISQSEFNKKVIQEKRQYDEPINKTLIEIDGLEKKLTSHNDKVEKSITQNKKLLKNFGINYNKYDVDSIYDNTMLKNLESKKTQLENNNTLDSVTKREINKLIKVLKKKEQIIIDLESNNNVLKNQVSSKTKSSNQHIRNAIDAFEEVMDNFDTHHYKIQDEKSMKKLTKELNDLKSELKSTKNKDSKKEIQDKIDGNFSKMKEIHNRSKRIKTKTYIPAVYKTDDIVANRSTVINDVKNAFRNSNKDLSEDKLDKLANDWVSKLTNKQISGSVAGKYDPLNGIHNSSRTLTIDRESMSKSGLMEDDSFELLNRYSMTMTGKMALKNKLGVSNKNELKEIKDVMSRDMLAQGMSDKDVKKSLKDFDTVFDIISGDYNVVNDPHSTLQILKRTLNPITNISYGLNFGVTGVAESGNIMAKYGINHFVKNSSKAVKQTMAKYKNTKNAIPLDNSFEMLGVGSNIANSKFMAKFSDTDEMYYNKNKYLDALKWGESKIFHGSGLIFITDTFKHIAATGFVGLVRDGGSALLKGGKLTKQMESDFARFGLSKNDIKIIAQNPLSKDKDGTITNIHLEKLPKNVRERFEVAINRSTKGSVLEPDSLDLPRFMTDPNNPIGQLIFQYLRFPVDAHNKLLAAGIDEKNVSTITAILYSSFIAANIMTARENSLVATGLIEKEKIRYNLDTDEGVNELLAATVNKTPHFAAFITGFNKLAPFLGFKPILSHYNVNAFANLAGPGLNKLEVATQAAGDLYSNSGEFTSKQKQFISQNSVIGSLPIAGDLLKLSIKDIGKE